MRIPIIMDCDPGWDDAIAIILALSNRDKFEVRAVTTVASNVSVAKTTENAKKILSFMNSNAILASGAEKPLVYELRTNEESNGKDGLFELFSNTDYAIDERKAHELIKDLLLDSEEKITIVATGALTNIALLIKEYPNALSKIDKICLMGGGIEYGNITTYAEYNFYVDSHAAKIVFDSGIPIIMCGLDVSFKVVCMEEDVNNIKKVGTEKAIFVSKILETRLANRSPMYKGEGCPLYDPTAIVYLISPESFETIDYRIDIEVDGEKRGQSKVIGTNNPNATVTMGVNREEVIKLLIDGLAK